MQGICSGAPSTAFLNNLYNVAVEQGDSALGLEKTEGKDIPLDRRAIKQLHSGSVEGCGIRRILTDAMSGAEETEVLKKVSEDLLGKDGKASRICPFRSPWRCGPFVRSGYSRRTSTPSSTRQSPSRGFPTRRERFSRKVIARYPDNTHIAEFLDSYSNNKVNLESFRCVCKLSADAGE